MSLICPYVRICGGLDVRIYPGRTGTWCIGGKCDLVHKSDICGQKGHMPWGISDICPYSGL